MVALGEKEKKKQTKQGGQSINELNSPLTRTWIVFFEVNRNMITLLPQNMILSSSRPVPLPSLSAPEFA